MSGGCGAGGGGCRELELWHLWFICSWMDEKHVLILFLFSFFFFFFFFCQRNRGAAISYERKDKKAREYGAWDSGYERSARFSLILDFVLFIFVIVINGRDESMHTHTILSFIVQPSVRSYTAG